MKISLKSLLSAITAAAIILMPALPLFAGNLDQPLAPTNPATAMFTVEDLYQRLLNGAAGTKRVGPFAEPSSGPTAGTRHTLDEIMGIAPALDNTNGAGLADVLSGKTFWGLTGTAWGPRIGTHTCPATATGTAVAADVLATKTFSNSSANGMTGIMPDNAAVTITPGATAQTIPAGYHNGSGTVATDANLVTGNIKNGVNIFGVNGKTEVVDTTEAASPAAATDILNGKKAFVNGLPVIGSLATQTVSNTTVSQPAGNYAAFNLSTVDTDLASGNIKSGMDIFGVAGDSKVMDTSTGTAAAADILSGKTAFVNGATVTGSVSAGGNITGANGSLSMTIPDGLYSGSKTATANDANLVTGNIKAGTIIFGVNGKTEVVDTAETTSPAAAPDILSGKKAFVNGLPVTGTVATQTLSAANSTVSAGYYSATTLDAVDSDLATGNIKAGATIFGVAGKTEVVDTTEGTSPAVAADILSGKKAFVNGLPVTGTIATQTLSAANSTVSAGYYSATTLDAVDADLASAFVNGSAVIGSLATQTVSNTTVSQPAGNYAAFNLSTVDSDLATGNIKAGTTIFGVLGDSKVMDTTSGTAAATDILSGKTAFVNGATVTGTVAAGSNVSGADGSKTFTITDGLYSGSKTATANDSDLVSTNIKSGVNIFGVTGTYPLAAVPKTGQTTSYATGDDGAHQKGVSLPSPRFTDNSNGTVTDNLTGLIWLKNANCFGTRNWTTALSDCNTLASGACGLTDGSTAGQWRLPNVRELYSLIDLSKNNPALTSGPFTNVQSNFYWSATTPDGNSTYAWFVGLANGHVDANLLSGTRYVWPVRGGQ